MISFFPWFSRDPIWTKIGRFGTLPNTVGDFDESKAETACMQCDCAEMDLIRLWFDAAVMPPCAKLQDVGRMAWRMARECLGGEVTQIACPAPTSQYLTGASCAASAVWGCLGGVDAIWGGADGPKPGKYVVRGPGGRVGGPAESSKFAMLGVHDGDPVSDRSGGLRPRFRCSRGGCGPIFRIRPRFSPI